MDKKTYELIAQQKNDHIIERRTCPSSGELFPIYQWDKDLLSKISPQIDGELFQLPLPVHAPRVRHMQRHAWRNLRSLYSHTSALSAKKCISIYKPGSPYKIYTTQERRSDAHDPLAYARDFDFSRSFFEQFHELQLDVPRAALLNGFDVNATYANHCYYLKDCYMAFASGYSERCYYVAQNIFECKNCVDCLDIAQCERCYECINCKDCFQCCYTSNTKNSSECYFSSDCENCSYCLGCYGLVNKKYMIYNQQVSKEIFESEKAKAIWSRTAIQEWKQKAKEFYTTCPHKATNQINCVYSSGNDLRQTKNVHMSYGCGNCEYIRYCSEMFDAKDCMDVDVRWENASRVYNTHCTGWNIDSIYCSNVIRNGDHVYYSDHCLQWAQYCFGCVWLKNQSYCIFNKQYSKQERWTQVKKIIRHMQATGERWQFFPTHMSPFPYEDTTGQDYYPLEWRKKSSIPVTSANTRTINWADLPETQDRVDEQTIETLILCEKSNRPFRITKQEQLFYKKQQIPLPHYHPDIRYDDRLSQRPSRNLYVRHCDITGKEILSVYPQEANYKVTNNESFDQQMYA